MRLTVVILSILALNSACEKPARPPAEQLELRLLYSMHTPGVPKHREELLEILSRASRAGYNGIVLNDFRVSILDHTDPSYLDGLREFSRSAADLGIEVIPSAGSFGWSEGMLYNDPNLVEALPVRDQRLTVRDGVARPDTANLVRNGGFEVAPGDEPAAWDQLDWMDATQIDSDHALTGRRSLLLEDTPANWLKRRMRS